MTNDAVSGARLIVKSIAVCRTLRKLWKTTHLPNALPWHRRISVQSVLTSAFSLVITGLPLVFYWADVHAKSGDEPNGWLANMSTVLNAATFVLSNAFLSFSYLVLTSSYGSKVTLALRLHCWKAFIGIVAAGAGIGGVCVVLLKYAPDVSLLVTRFLPKLSVIVACIIADNVAIIFAKRAADEKPLIPNEPRLGWNVVKLKHPRATILLIRLGALLEPLLADLAEEPSLKWLRDAWNVAGLVEDVCHVTMGRYTIPEVIVIREGQREDVFDS